MPRTPTQARAARKLRRDNPWIGINPDAAALAQQLIYLATTMDTQAATTGRVRERLARTYLDTRTALLNLEPRA